MKIVVISGGDGYIGSAIKRALNKHEEIKTISIDINPKSKDTLNFDLALDGETDDLYNTLTQKNIQRGDQYIGWIHCAAWKDLNESYNVPFEYYDNNLKSLINSLGLAHRLGVEKFIFSSSAAIYPDDMLGETKESDLDLNKTASPYGFTKAIGERIVHEIATQYKFTSVCFRYGNPMGTDGDSLDLTTTMFGNVVNCLKNNETFHIFGGDYPHGDGTCIRDYIDLRDLVLAHIKVISTPIVYPIHESINLGSGKPISCLEICKTVQKLYPEFKYDIVEKRAGDAYGCYFNTNLATAYEFQGDTSLEDSIKNLIKTAMNK